MKNIISWMIMTRKRKKILILSLKIGLGSAIAILFAYMFGLDNPTSAGTIALLSLLTTKWGTTKLIFRRITTFLFTIALCFVLFPLVPSKWIAFGVIIGILVAHCEFRGVQNTLSVNAMIAVHYLTSLDFSLHYFLNEFYLVLIGSLIAFFLNLFHDYVGDEKQLKNDIVYTEDKLKRLLKEIIDYIHSDVRGTTIWKELEILEGELEIFIGHAIEYQDNTFTSLPAYYIHYFEMRQFQCKILHMLHYELRKLRGMPKSVKVVSDYLEYLIPFIKEKHDPQEQLDYLNETIDVLKKDCVCKTAQDFEAQAIVYHILMDIEDFLLAKKNFVNHLNEEQKKLYFQEDLS